MSSTTTTTSVLSVEEVGERSVRFDEECVLIPENSRPPRKGLQLLNSRPRLAAKSFSLPIWSNSGNQEKPSVDDDKETGRKLTIALPSFRQSKETSPTEVRAMPPCLRSPDRERSNCLHRSRSPPQHRDRCVRVSSLPVMTMPLRGCCKACIPAVDAYLASPSKPEHMTTGAKRLMRSASQHHHLAESKVMVDEMDMIRKDIHKVTIGEETPEEQNNESPSQPRPTQLKLNVGVCFYEDADECELFPLPSPSPRNSPCQSPLPSPVASQTNLATSVNRSIPSPVIRGNSPLAVCCLVQSEEPMTTTEGILREEVARSIHSATVLPTTPANAESSPQPVSSKSRRPSLSGIGLNISKGSLAIVKGLSGLGGNASVGT